MHAAMEDRDRVQRENSHLQEEITRLQQEKEDLVQDGVQMQQEKERLLQENASIWEDYEKGAAQMKVCQLFALQPPLELQLPELSRDTPLPIQKRSYGLSSKLRREACHCQDFHGL